MKVCIVGNKGSFFSDVVRRFNSSGVVTNSYDAEYVLNHSVHEVIDIKDCSVLVFIGGETRFEDKMKKYNFILPKILMSFCIKSQLKFVYLSTLSVFGWSNKDVVTLNSKRLPYDRYGVTKNQFDQFLAKSNYKNYVALYPASIDAGRGRSSVEKFDQLMASYPILKRIRLLGCLSIITRNELIKYIIDSSISCNKKGNYIVSNHKQLSDFSSKVYINFPKLPSYVFSGIKFLFGPKRAMLLKMLIRGVEYR